MLKKIEASSKTCQNLASAETLLDVLETTTREYPQNLAVQMWEGGRLSVKYTFAELLKHVRETGEYLQNLGLRPGYRTAIIMENHPQWVVAFFAILMTQGTPVLIDPRLETADYGSLLEIADPQCIITCTHVKDKIDTSFKHKMPILDGHQGFTVFSDCPVNHVEETGVLDRDPEAAAMLFTSGTTGVSKAVVQKSKALIYSTLLGVYSVNSDPSFSALCILPLTHIFALVACLIAPIASGSCVTYIDRVHGKNILSALQYTQSAVVPLVPRVIELIHGRIQQQIGTKSPLMQKLIRGVNRLCQVIAFTTGWSLGKYVFHSIQNQLGGRVRAFMSGGSALDPQLRRSMEGFGIPIIEGYGLTETGIVTTTHYKNRTAVGSVGVAPDWIKIKIDAPNEKGEGEVLIRGKSLMTEYFREPKETANLIKEGWLHTGDLGRLDERGNLWITGRIKEMIVLPSGEKAVPEDVERRYKGIAGIAELAVFGFPSAPGITAEDIHAAVIVTEELRHEIHSEIELLKLVNCRIMNRSERVPSHLRIHKVHLVSSIPKTLTLKVKRGVLRERVFEQHLERDSVGQKPHASLGALGLSVITMIKKVAEGAGKPIGEEVSLESSFQMDLNFDSLTALELAFALEERYKMRLQAERLENVHTVGDLVKLIEQEQNVIKE